MKDKTDKTIFFLLLIIVLGACNGANQTEDSPPKIKAETIATPIIQKIKVESKFNILILKPEGKEIIDKDAKIEVIAQGQRWSEGPLYVPNGDYFLYSDVPENSVFKWKEGEGKSVFLKPSGYTGIIKRPTARGSNGLLLNDKGQLVLMQQGDRRVALCTAPLENIQPEFVTLVDNYQGKQLNSPNDGTFHSNGDLYFTDPPYGMGKQKKEVGFSGVYRLKPDGHLDVVTKELRFPNGLALSPDEKRLYVASSDSENLVWMVYELDENGLAKNSRVFYDANAFKGHNTGSLDGMKINKAGIIFATAPGGVWIFNEKAELLAKIFTGQKTANCALSSDEKILFLTADDYILKVPLL